MTHTLHRFTHTHTHPTDRAELIEPAALQSGRYMHMLSYVLSSSLRSGSCGINLVDLKVEST